MSTKYRLVYLWVEKYKNIKDVEINFTLDYQFKKNKKDKVISLDKSHFGELSEKGSNPLAILIYLQHSSVRMGLESRT
ncbi:hypothetical protein [Psychromonas sp. MME2]|uniref:hypothetical protein n=1 Tax=Psychromonas sp. MME2 TaxID=3231033 RepID=UPI00339CB400